MSTLDLLTDVRRVVEMPLSCDPSIRAANPAAKVLALQSDSETDGLIIPEDSIVASIRALSAVEVDEAEGAVGVAHPRGEYVYRRVFVAYLAAVKPLKAMAEALHARAVALDAAIAEGGAEANQAEADRVAAELKVQEEAASNVLAEVEAALTPEDAALRADYRRWVARRNREIARRALVAIRAPGFSVEAGPKGFPVEQMAHSRLGPAIVEEVAGHAIRLGTLTPPRPQSSDTTSGARTPTAPGSLSAADAPETFADSAGTAAGCSAPT